MAEGHSPSIVTSHTPPISAVDAWPALPLDAWKDTYATLHMWMQIVGKTRLALAPAENHGWHVALHPTARGLVAPGMAVGARLLDIEFDFIDHRLIARTSDGARRDLLLRAMPVADFYREYRALLGELGVVARFHGRPNEVVEAIPFAEDVGHAAYDPDAAQRCWRIIAQGARVLRTFRSRFVGKCSPAHFWWGGFDLSCTRFSGRPAPRHPGGFPNLPDHVTREAYSHEVASAGFWPGNDAFPHAAFYAYAYPEPAGCPAAAIRPRAASYHLDLREWVLPYEAVRTAADPDHTLLEFLQSTYDVAADLGKWDRGTLER